MARDAAPIDTFIVYAHGDGIPVQALADALRRRDLTPFSDHDLRLGDVWDEVLPAKLVAARAVAVVISRRWPKLGERGETWYGPEEVAIAIQRAREAKPPLLLIPIWLDGAADRTPYGLRRVVGVDVADDAFDVAADGIAAVLADSAEARPSAATITTAERLLASATWSSLLGRPILPTLAGVALLAGAMLGLLFADPTRAPGCHKLLAFGALLLIVGFVVRHPRFVERPRVFQIVVLASLLSAALGFGATGVYQLVVPPRAEQPTPRAQSAAGGGEAPNHRARAEAAIGDGADRGPSPGPNGDGAAERPKAAGSDDASGEDVARARTRDDSAPGSGPTGEARAAPGLPGYVEIPAGTFVMGSPDGEVSRFSHEGPQHRVTFTRPLWVKRHEVTQAEWKRLMGTAPSAHRDCPSCPVEQVSWYQAVAFANAQSAEEGLQPCYRLVGCDDAGIGCASVDFAGLRCEGYRLPTEAEWEYFARAGTTTRYSSGDDEAALAKAGWYDANSGGKTHPEGGKAANPWGLHDVHGNVWEWCHDWKGAYSAEATTDPLGPPSGRVRVIRGGSFVVSAARARSAFRDNWWRPLDRVRDVGFRLVRAPRAP